MRIALAALGLASSVVLAPAVAIAAEGPPKFDLMLTLSPAAAAKLAGMKEAITVSAMYSGQPTKAARKAGKATEVDEVDLGEETATLQPSKAPQTAHFVGKGFKAGEVKWIAPGTAGVLINVYSARKVSDDNLLDCDIFQDVLKVAAAKPIEISCKLIGE